MLRQKWGEVPSGRQDRVLSARMTDLSDSELIAAWSRMYADSSRGKGFSVRGWYQTLYTDIFRGKKVLDFGCGLAIDTILYAEYGALVTFVDIVEANLRVVERLCRLKKLKAGFCYLDELSALSSLPADYDAIYCCGSLIHAPVEMIRLEAQELLQHLPIGGRWIELAYPKARWEREGGLPFDRWGAKTDGEATPWAEWHDLPKILDFLAPATFDVILDMEFHNSDYNWFDLMRRT